MLKTIVIAGFLAVLVSAAPVQAAAETTLKGTVVSRSGNQVRFVTTSGATYYADTSYAKLTKRYGSPLELSDIEPRDKVEVTGTVLPEGIVRASSLRDITLYLHSGTFTGKVTAFVGSSLVLSSSRYPQQTVVTDQATVFKKNSHDASFSAISFNDTITVKGNWERTPQTVYAKQVTVVERLVNIEFTGQLVLRSPGSLTVVGTNNALYAVDISAAAIKSKNNLPISWAELTMGGPLRVVGKHAKESLKVVAKTVKDQTYVK